MLDPILNLFFFEICSTYFSNIFCFFVVYLIPLHVDQIDPFLCSLMPKLSSSRWWTLLPPPPQLLLPNMPLHRLFLQRKCLCPDALIVTAPLILKNIGYTDSPRLLCFGGSQWIVFLMVSWILIVTTVWLLLPLPRQKRNALPEVSLHGKTRRMARWRLFCRRIHCGTKLTSAIFWCWNRNLPWQRNSARGFVFHIPISCNW